MSTRSKRPIGKQPPTPARLAGTAATAPDPVIAQAKRDIDAGQVDTDMHATPGLDAKLRAELVPGPGGKPPASVRLHTNESDM